MYINFWYPVCESADLAADAPLRTQLLGMRFVAFRDSGGAAHVLADTCVHRGGSLGKGVVQGDCVQCPYHGWQFGGDGRCRHIPSMQDAAPPARAKVDSYPVIERYGIVFTFLGDLPEEERPPPGEIVQYGQDNWRASDVMILNIKCYYERSMENGLDPEHNAFVHPAQGFPEMKRDTFELQDLLWGSRFDARFGEPDLSMTRIAKHQERPDDLKAASWFHGPNVLVTEIQISTGKNFIQYFFEAPVDDSHTKIYFVNMRNFMLEPERDETVQEVNLRVTYEDIDILENLYPVRTPKALNKEIMTESDTTVVRFREWLRQWDENGWRIDTKALRGAAGDVAYAIPCPDRRRSGNWVLPPLPTLPGA